MKKLLALLVATMFAVGAAYAQDKGKAEAKANPQQTRMKECNDKAGDKKGDERKKFMSACLSGQEPVKATQQDKMKACNADAGKKNLKGEERKKFMSECLRG